MAHLPREVQEVLDTVDVLRYVAYRREKELPSVAWYFGVWGTYVTVNRGLELLGVGGWWRELLFPTFCLSTVPVAGWGASIGVWAVLGGLTWLGYRMGGAGVALGLTVAFATLGYAGLYRYAIHTGRWQPLASLRNSLAPWVGWACGMLAAGAALLQFVLMRSAGAGGGVVSLLVWNYMTGAMLMFWGIYHPAIFFLGVGTLFLIPGMAMVSPVAAHGAFTLVYALVALTGFGLYFRFRGRSHGHTGF